MLSSSCVQEEKKAGNCRNAASIATEMRLANCGKKRYAKKEIRPVFVRLSMSQQGYVLWQS